jgi:hypothetical protein
VVVGAVLFENYAKTVAPKCVETCFGDFPLLKSNWFLFFFNRLIPLQWWHDGMFALIMVDCLID